MHRCSMHCIIPPHMMDAVRLRGDDAQKQMVNEMEQAASEIRVGREAVDRSEALELIGALAGETDGAPALAEMAAAPGGLHRAVYDANQRAVTPGQLVRAEGDAPTGDNAVDEAYDHAGYTYELFDQHYGRDSLDGHGLPLVLSVHYRRNHNNAYWNGSQMLFGDADGQLFVVGSFTRSLSVVGHELSHGVIRFSGGLVYSGQSGALNEHIADVFGALTDQHHRGDDANNASWRVGENTVVDPAGGPGQPLRSMRAPGTAYDHPVLGTDPQPYHMDGFVFTTRDYGGVHINSGIPNHAFYLLARYLGGNAWERAGQIWYDALQALNDPNASFVKWADETINAALTRYGVNSDEHLFTRRAWKLVGVV